MDTLFSEGISAQLRQDLNALGPFSRASFGGLVDIVLRLIINPPDGGVKSSAVVSAVKAFAVEQEIKDMGGLQSGVRGLVSVLQLAARRGSTSREVRESAVSAGLDASHAAVLERIWEDTIVAPSAGVEADDSIPDTETLRRLVDLEWKFGVTAASSESCSAQVGKTFLQLKLILDKAGGGLESIYLELSLNQFYELLSHMERAKLALQTTTH